MLVFGVVSPHPPLILPEIGGDDTMRVQRTVDALETAAIELGKTDPEMVIIISPHRDYGFEVPLYYLRRHLRKDVDIEKILVSNPSYGYYYEAGKEVGARIKLDRRRYAIIASGDLSHVLESDGAYGFHPSGPVIDDIIIKAVRERDVQALLNIDSVTLEEGAECGLRSILFLLGALEGLEVESRVLSFEGPFGVGYLVATFEVE